MLTKEQVRTFYDRFGAKQDWQGIYEDRAVRDLLAQANFQEAQAVFEFGCGTGRFAATLLTHYLPDSAIYLGCDLSSTMVHLSQARLSRLNLAGRAVVQLTDGAMPLNVPDASFDCFVSTYVLDLLPETEITRLLAEAHRILMPGGQLCLVSLSYGASFFSRLVVSLWTGAHAWRPDLVGGCRPLNLLDFISAETWQITHHNTLTVLGMTSEVVVAQK